MRVHPSLYKQSSFYWQMPLGLLLLFVTLVFNLIGDSADASSEQIEILVTKANLRAGIRFEEILFEKKLVSKDIQPEAISDFELIRGCKTRGPIARGSGVSAFLVIGDCKLFRKPN